jgi:hypothetical protein
VDATFRLTLGDVFRASAEGARHSWLAAIFGFMFVYGFFFSVLVADFVTIAFAAVGFGFSTGWLSGLVVAIGASRRRDLLALEHTLHVDRDGISWVSSGSASREAWGMYRRIRDMRSDFLLDSGTGSATFVPKRVLTAEQVATFRHLAASAGLLVAGSSWVRPVIGYAVGVGACALLYIGTSGVGGA